MNDDFESRFARVLNEQVDARLGERQAAPPFDPSRSITTSTRMRRRSARPWIIPLVAAAAVVVVAAGTLGVSRLVADNRNSPAGTQTPPAPTPTPTPTPTAGVRTVSLGAAKISLPAGWEARDLKTYAAPGSSFPLPGWCLTPTGVPTSTKDGSCPIVLFTAGNSQSLDVDIEGGLTANPEYCFQGNNLGHHAEQTGDEDFGGRAADWRHWTIACTTGQTYDIEQYVVATGPAYILSSQHADGRYHQALTEIAANSTLPAQQLPVRLMDRGIVRELTRTSAGYRLRLDRVIDALDKRVNENPATYEYIVPTQVLDGATNNGPVRVGSTVSLWTNGHVVTLMYSS